MRTCAAVAVLLIVLGLTVFGGPSPATAVPSTTVADAPLLVVLDTSGSMGSDDSKGVNKLASAKRSVLGVVDKLADSTAVGVWTYPGGSCAPGGYLPGLDMRPLTADLRTKITADVLALRDDGDTPTGPALESAVKSLTAKGFRGATVILVSDGEYTCGVDPCDLVTKIRDQGFDLRVYSVGFELSDKGSRQLKCISDKTLGQYFEATNGQELINTVSSLVNRKLEVSVTAPERAIGGGTATIRVSVHNTSRTETARDVRVSLAFTDGAAMFPRLTPPVVRLGNLAPDGREERTWNLPVATTDNQVSAVFRVVATSASGANGAVERKIDVVKSGDYARVAGGLLKTLLDGTGTVGVFGDSYASGEGAGNYRAAKNGVSEWCHRSDDTHVAQLFGRDRTQNFACSGAVQAHLTGPYPGRVELMSQIEEMSKTDTTLDAAFLSIGGNDLGFASIVQRCLWPNQVPVGALAPIATGEAWWASIDLECGHADANASGQPVGTTVQDRSIGRRLAEIGTQLPGTYTAVYDAINVEPYVDRRGHEAPLFVLGYPKVFPEVTGIGCGEFAPREVTFANRLVDELNRTLAVAVGKVAETGRRISFVDAVGQAMQPSNTLCDGNGSGIVSVGLLEGLYKSVADPWHKQELVHPNTTGYARIAGAVAMWSSAAGPSTADGRTARQAPTVTSGKIVCDRYAVRPPPELRLDTSECLTTKVEVRQRSTYWVEVQSVPIALGSGVLEPGEGEIRIHLPATLPPGRHTLNLIVVGEDGETTSYATALVVSAPLPWWWWAIVAASIISVVTALILLTVTLLRVRRRRTAGNG